MSDLQKSQQMMAAAVAAKDIEDPEISAVKQLIKLLDKASKNIRTFGPTNPVSQRFFEQFYDTLTTHLEAYSFVSFLVQRSELFFKDVSVYGSSADSSTENLAFKLYADGIRELTLQEGMSREDLAFFLEALWTTADHNANDDHDIVTRLWEKNLPTVSLVTADEAMELSDTNSTLDPQEGQTLNSSPSSLRAVAEQERAKPAGEPNRPRRLQGNVTGYEVTEAETVSLANEIAEESRRENTLYILDILTAILAAEESPETIDKLIDTFDKLIEAFAQEGQWAVLETVLLLLYEVESVRPDITEEQKRKFRSLSDNMGSPERLGLIEQYLNKPEKPNTGGLNSIFLMMPSTCIPAMCKLLAGLKNPQHQAMLMDVIIVMAKDDPDPVLRSLTDRRPVFVRNILSILVKWANPQHADALEKLFRYPDPGVRRDAVKTLSLLRPKGNGTKLIQLLNDADESVRLATFALLLTGNYTAPYSAWEPIMTDENFSERPPAEKRNLFYAMQCMAGDETVPFLTSLLTDRGWMNRKKREELALLAADALGKLATPAAIEALQTGQLKGGSAVKQACTAALSVAAKQAAVGK